MKRQIEAFIRGKEKNKWIADDGMKVYVRKANRLGKKALDIGTVEAYEHGKGNWKRFVGILRTCDLSAFELIYVENVMNERFAKWFVANGWMGCNPSDYDVCFCIEVGAFI